MTRETWGSTDLCVEAQIKTLCFRWGPCRALWGGPNKVGTRVRSENACFGAGCRKENCILDDMIIPRRYRLIYRGNFEN